MSYTVSAAREPTQRHDCTGIWGYFWPPKRASAVQQPSRVPLLQRSRPAAAPRPSMRLPAYRPAGFCMWSSAKTPRMIQASLYPLLKRRSSVLPETGRQPLCQGAQDYRDLLMLISLLTLCKQPHVWTAADHVNVNTCILFRQGCLLLNKRTKTWCSKWLSVMLS